MAKTDRWQRWRKDLKKGTVLNLKKLKEYPTKLVKGGKRKRGDKTRKVLMGQNKQAIKLNCHQTENYLYQNHANKEESRASAIVMELVVHRNLEKNQMREFSRVI